MVPTAERKLWHRPHARRFGTFADATQQNVTKTVGAFDGVTFDIDGNGPIPGVPIGVPS